MGLFSGIKKYTGFTGITKGIGGILGQTDAGGSGGTRDALNEYNQFIGGINPQVQSARGIVGSYRNPLLDQRSAYASVSTAPLADQFAMEASGGAQRAQVDAAIAARGFSARGGLAFGGGAAALAGAAGRDASVSLTSLMSDARMQGAAQDRQIQLARAQGLDQHEALQADLRENQIQRRLGFEQGDLANRFGLFGGLAQQGLSGNVARNQNKNIIGSVAGLLGGAI